jgi:hypothetical protein
VIAAIVGGIPVETFAEIRDAFAQWTKAPPAACNVAKGGVFKGGTRNLTKSKNENLMLLFTESLKLLDIRLSAHTIWDISI